MESLNIGEQMTTKTALKFITDKVEYFDKLKSHIIEVDNKIDNGDDYYFIVLEKTKETRELLEELKE